MWKDNYVHIRINNQCKRCDPDNNHFERCDPMAKTHPAPQITMIEVS